MPDDEEPLDASWAILRPANREPPNATAVDPSFADFVEPTDLVIGSRRNPLVLIKKSGRLMYGPDYTPDEAAITFWEAMGQRRIGTEDRILLFQHMEAILTRLGTIDLRAQSLREQAAEAEDEARKRELNQLADLAVAHLEMIAHEAIELGRGLARRDMEVPPIPAEIPEVIRNNENSGYRGAGYDNET